MALVGNVASSVGDFRKTVTSAGTAVALSATSISCFRVWICAETDNTGGICVGSSTVDETLGTRRGRYLTPGEGDWFYPKDLTMLYVDSSVNGDGVNVYYEAA